MKNTQNRSRPGPKPGKRHTGQFRPGNKANPGGRPKNAVSLTHWVRECLAATNPPTDAQLKRLPLVQRLAWRIVSSALEASDRDAGKLIGMVWDRVDGKVPDRVEMSNGTLRIRYVDDWRGTGDQDPASAPGDAVGAPGPAPDDAAPGGPALAQDDADGDGER